MWKAVHRVKRQTFIAAILLWPSDHMKQHVIGLLGQSTKPVKPFQHHGQRLVPDVTLLMVKQVDEAMM